MFGDGIPADTFWEFCRYLEWTCEEVAAGRLAPGQIDCRYGVLPADINAASRRWWSRARTDGKGCWREH
jgi:hypothetical protein